MEWLKSMFSGENSAITLVVIVVGLAIALVLLAWVFRKIAGDSSIKMGRNRQPRLSVTDAAIVDDKRRLVLVRRDNIEHLVMIGGPSDIVIEQNIVRAHPAAAHPERVQHRTPPASDMQAQQEHEQAQATNMAEPEAEPARHRASGAAMNSILAPRKQRQAAPAEPSAAPAANDAGNGAAGEADNQTGEASPVNGHALAEEIEIDLQELQMAIDRSQFGAAPAQAAAAPVAAAPAVEAPVVQQQAPAAAQVAAVAPVKAPSLDMEASAPKPVGKAARAKSMEDEMQRLLDELSGPVRN